MNTFVFLFIADNTFSFMSLSKNVTQCHIPQVQCTFNILQEWRRGEKESCKIRSGKALRGYLPIVHFQLKSLLLNFYKLQAR